MFCIKTLVELFDECQIENVIAGLRLKPEKIVFVGFKETMTKKRIKALEKFFELRGIDIVLEFEIVGRYDYDAIYNKLNAILEANEDCCFDLTGGKELVLTAMGAVSALRDVPMLQFNVRSGNLIKVKNCEEIEDSEKSSMLISESVVLNGGSVVYDEVEDFKWDLNDGFKKDIDTIWESCKKDCGLWNRQSRVFENFEKFGTIDEEYRVRVNIQYMSERNLDTLLDERIIKELTDSGLLSDYACNGEILTFKYKDAQVHRCITKAGNILELCVYKAAKEIVAADPKYYDDIDIGIYVDWDGVIHNITDAEKDTRNEIDVMLMRDLIPVFISCKNGEVHKEALYELSTVAERFGGEYAKKMLITTYISANAESRKYILQRARDMKIDIIEGVDKMDKEEFISTLKKRAV